MTIKSVLKMGNKKLTSNSLPVTNFSDGELKELIENMRETMKEHGGVGIAAPQIGCLLRVIMFGFEHNPRYPNEKPVPYKVVINPVCEPISKEMIDGWEGCLSVPGLRGLVPRYKNIIYSGYDSNANPISYRCEKFQARIIQHECDHINGILFPHRIKNMKFFGFEEELKTVL